MIDYEINDIVVWGCGYIGLSDLAYYSDAGFSCYGMDTNPDIEELLMKGDYKQDLIDWLDIDILRNIMNGRIKFLSVQKLHLLTKELLHIISVPSENDGKPDMSAIDSVFTQICEFEMNRENKAINIMIESTMIPGTAKRCLENIQKNTNGKLINFCVAPRRDWFVSKEKDMKRLHRVFGTNSEVANEVFDVVLSRVCNNPIMAIDYQHAEATKSVENAFRHMDIVLANQLSDAFPKLNIRHVLELVGTKWNIDTYKPSFGTGGYCIPLSSRYVLEAAENDIPLLKDTVEYDMKRPYMIADVILAGNPKKIGILGLTYKNDIKVSKNCPVSVIIGCLADNDVRVYLHDPLYTEGEIKALFPKSSILVLDDRSVMDDLDALIVYTGHSAFYEMNWKELLSYRKKKIVIYDNVGLFEDILHEAQEMIEYHLVGKERNNSEYIL
jgi:nucleotide sugar dehydrogenase